MINWKWFYVRYSDQIWLHVIVLSQIRLFLWFLDHFCSIWIRFHRVCSSWTFIFGFDIVFNFFFFLCKIWSNVVKFRFFPSLRSHLRTFLDGQLVHKLGYSFYGEVKITTLNYLFSIKTKLAGSWFLLVSFGETWFRIWADLLFR